MLSQEKAGEEEDDDLDLFGDETEEDKKAAAEREAAVKASSKKKESMHLLFVYTSQHRLFCVFIVRVCARLKICILLVLIDL